MKNLHEIFKTLSDKTRMQIVLTLFKKGEMSCKDVSLNFKELTQPTISHHFKILGTAGIITVRKSGTENFYSLNKSVLQKSGIDLSLIK
jgi:ArsR family transcriptional regulator